MSTIIREMTINDIDEVYNMFNDLYKHLNETGFIWKLNLKNLKESLKLQLNSKFMKVFLLEYNGIISGFINVALIKISSKFITDESKFTCHITELFIKKEYRGNGFAKLLVYKAREFAKDNNVKYLQVNTMVQNTNAVEFYKKTGFDEDFISFITT